MITMTKRFNYIFDYLKNNYCESVLEIGVFKGDTAKTMLEVSLNKDIKYTGIDLFEDLTDNTGRTENINIKEIGRPLSVSQTYAKLGNKNVRLLKGFSRDILPKLQNEKFDLIFIDGGHSYQTVKSDFINCLNLIKENGIIFIDDYTEEPNKAGIKKFIDGLGSVKILPASDSYRNFEYRLAEYKPIKKLKNKIDVLTAFDKNFLKLFENSFISTLPPQTELYGLYINYTVDSRFTGFNRSKMEFTLNHLRNNKNLVLFSDCDITFLRSDVLKLLDEFYEQNGKPDICMQLNIPNETEKNIGFMLLKPSERLCSLIEKYLTLSTDEIIQKYGYGQRYFNELLNTKFQDLKVVTLPIEFYGKQLKGFFDIPENIAIYHATFEETFTDKYNILNYFKNIYR